jgi:hypothetical protein
MMTDTTNADIDDRGRCEALMMPNHADDLPAYRCCREATTLRKGRAVCPAHSARVRHVEDLPAIRSAADVAAAV